MRRPFVAATVLVTIAACSSTTEDDEPTFAKSIEPLVQEKCQRCHREGGIAPFTLTSYEDVKQMGNLAKDMVVSRKMPPWGAFDDDRCKVRFKFKDDLSLTQEQVDLFARWVDRGMPQGDMSARPGAKTFPPDGLASKTHTFEMAKPHEVVAGTPDDIRCFPIDPGFTEDTWIGATHVMPGDPRVVHHVIVFVDTDGESVTKAGEAGSYPCFGGPGLTSGYPTMLSAWAPGVPPQVLGDTTGIKVDKGSKLVMQVHYHPYSATTTDRTAIEVQTLPFKPGYVAQVLLLGNAQRANGRYFNLLPGPSDPPEGPAFVIPPNAKDHTESMEFTMPAKVGDFDVPAMSVSHVGAHMHWAGVDLKIEVERATKVDGQPDKECLLGTPKYDFNWQRAYEYDAKLEDLPVVGPGDKLRFTCRYDNTMANPNVQRAMSEQRMASPPEIRLGEATLEEMCLGVLVTVRRATLLD